MGDHFLCGKASRTVRLRVARRGQRVSLCNEVISTLNLLYDGRGARHASTSTNAAQRESLSRLFQAVNAFGSPPADLSGDEALRELLAKKGYHGESATVASLSSNTLTPFLSQSTELFPELWKNLEEIRVVTSLSVF